MTTDPKVCAARGLPEPPTPPWIIGFALAATLGAVSALLVAYLTLR